MSITLICESCGTLFTPDEARYTTVYGPEYAEYGCPDCEWTVRSSPPSETAETDDKETS